MTDFALIKLLVLSLFLLGAVRLFVTVFLGDREVGPTIGFLFKRRGAVAAATTAIAKLRPSFRPVRRPPPVSLTERSAHGQRSSPPTWS